MVMRRKTTKTSGRRWDWKFPEYCNGNVTDWRELSDQCKRRDGYKCQECGALGRKLGGVVELNACHIVSKSRGGKDALENLTTKCVNCHAKEHPHMRHRIK